jgi:hypothetical protein
LKEEKMPDHTPIVTAPAAVLDVLRAAIAEVQSA